MREGIDSGKGLKTPECFAKAHSNDSKGSEDADAFLAKQNSLDLCSQVRDLSASVLDSETAAELQSHATDTFRAFCPTILDRFLLIAAHPMMHAGQFAVVRRQLGKPFLM